jgi:sugar phosphate isomerase/epimerase
MDISICSYSFHRLLAAGKQDIFQYIKDCKRLGCTHLDPWSGHFEAPGQKPGEVPLLSQSRHLEYLSSIKAAAELAGLPFGCIAVDGAHIYEDSAEARQANRQRASNWLELAAFLGAKQVRIDAGYRAEVWPAEVFATIVTGYQDLLAEAKTKGLELVIENHWGPSQHPAELLRLLEAVKDLGLLFDTHNWAAGKQQEAWERCAKYARAVHVKTFAFEASGNEANTDIAKAIRLLQEAGYSGIWGIESVPEDGDELAGAAKTVALLRRLVG